MLVVSASIRAITNAMATGGVGLTRMDNQNVSNVTQGMGASTVRRGARMAALEKANVCRMENARVWPGGPVRVAMLGPAQSNAPVMACARVVVRANVKRVMQAILAM